MTMNPAVLEAEAMKLGPPDRSHLLEKLIASLDLDPEIEAAWEEEADQREAELAAGTATCIPGEQFVAQLRTRSVR